MLCSSSAGRLQEGGLTFLDLRLLTAQSRMKGPQTDSALGRLWYQMVGWHHRLDGHESEQAPMIGREAWPAAVHGVARSRTRLSN